MGYSASGSGELILKENAKISPEQRSKLEEAFSEVDETEEGGKYILSLCHEYTRYSEDIVLEALDAVKGNIVNGEVQFSGDDDAYWRFIFREGRWVEQDGKVVYGKEISIKTSLGDLVVEQSGYTQENYPGFIVSLQRPNGEKVEAVLVEVDQSNQDEKPTLKVHVWNRKDDEPVYDYEDQFDEE